MPDPVREASSRFMKLEDVATELSVTQAQVYALVRNGLLVGGHEIPQLAD